MMIQHRSSAQTETDSGNSGQINAKQRLTDHSQCVPDRPAWRARPTVTAVTRERIKLSGFWSVLPETELQAVRLHVEYLAEMTTARLLYSVLSTAPGLYRPLLSEVSYKHRCSSTLWTQTRRYVVSRRNRDFQGHKRSNIFTVVDEEKNGGQNRR